MGWLFGWNTRKELADHLIRGNGVHTIKRTQTNSKPGLKAFRAWVLLPSILTLGALLHCPQEAGAEKLRYISGYAIAVNHKGEQISVSLADIYQLARATWGIEPTDASY